MNDKYMSLPPPGDDPGDLRSYQYQGDGRHRKETLVRPDQTTQKIMQARKALPFDELLPVWTKYFWLGKFNNYGQLDAQHLLHVSDATISEQDYESAPILVTIDFEKLNGYKDRLEKPTIIGNKYLGDLNQASEMGITTLDVRWLFEKVPNASPHMKQPVRFRHRKSAGLDCLGWLDEPNLIKFKHFVSTDHLAEDLDKLSGRSSALKELNSRHAPGTFAFNDTKFLRSKVMTNNLKSYLHNYMKLNSKHPRMLYLCAHAAKMEVSLIDAYQIPEFDHRDPNSFVRFVDIQDSPLWDIFSKARGQGIGGEPWAKSLGVSCEFVRPHNGGNDTAVSMLGMLRFVMITKEDKAKYNDGIPLPTLSPFPAYYPDFVVRNTAALVTQTEIAKASIRKWRQDDLETAQIDTHHREPSTRSTKQNGNDTHLGLVQTSKPTGLSRTPAQVTGKRYAHPLYEDSYAESSEHGRKKRRNRKSKYDDSDSDDYGGYRSPDMC